MPKSLPTRPCLERLKNEAKTVLRAHSRGDPGVCAKLSLHHRFNQASAEEILSASVSLQEIQHALALGYGFKNWKDLKSHVARESAYAERLAEMNPTYGEVKDDLPEIWKLAGSQNDSVAKTARWHVANAFQRAPMSQCLLWLGGGDAELNQLIWQQIDARIRRADATRKAGYRDVAVKVLQADVDANTKLASLKLLERLQDRQAVGPLIELLPNLPKEVGPGAGAVLRNLTGQEFGPRSGDGIVEIHVAAQKWRTWWTTGGKDGTNRPQ